MFRPSHRTTTILWPCKVAFATMAARRPIKWPRPSITIDWARKPTGFSWRREKKDEGFSRWEKMSRAIELPLSCVQVLFWAFLDWIDGIRDLEQISFWSRRWESSEKQGFCLEPPVSTGTRSPSIIARIRSPFQIRSTTSSSLSLHFESNERKNGFVNK